jgi:hypothetical protein
MQGKKIRQDSMNGLARQAYPLMDNLGTGPPPADTHRSDLRLQLAALCIEHTDTPDNVKQDETTAPNGGGSFSERVAAGEGMQDKHGSGSDPSPETEYADKSPTFVDHPLLTGLTFRSKEPIFNFQTMITASRTIFFDIFDIPACLSIKIIGSSPTLKPHSRQR